MWWPEAWTIRFKPKQHLERTLEWHRSTYERVRQGNIHSMAHVVLARVFLQWEKKEPGPDLASGGIKDLSWACDVTQYFACLPPPDAVETMAVFMALDRRPSLAKEVPEVMPRYNGLMNIIASGVENNTLTEMYKRQNLEPINEENSFYDRAIGKLFVKTIHVSEVGGQKES